MLSKINRMEKFIRGQSQRDPIVSPYDENAADDESAPRKQSYLGPTVHISGDIVLDEDLRVEGQVDGAITIRGNRLSVGKDALVKAEIHASTVEVRGRVEGDVYGEEIVRVYETADISGSIYCKRIVVEDGACFNGLFRTSRDAEKSSGSNDASKQPKPKDAPKAPEKSTLKSIGA